MPKKISEKMGLKPGMRAYFHKAPSDAVSAIDPPDLSVGKTARGTFDYIHLFAKKRD